MIPYLGKLRSKSGATCFHANPSKEIQGREIQLIYVVRLHYLIHLLSDLALVFPIRRQM